VREEEVFPEVSSGRPWLPHSEWDWEVSFKTSYREYVENQYEKDLAVYAVHDAVGRIENIQKLAAPWIKSQGTRSRDTTCRVHRGHRQSAGCNGARNATERRKRQLEMPRVVTFVQIGS
jgi:hypothetical protein